MEKQIVRYKRADPYLKTNILVKIGRSFYGIAMMAYGIQQIIIQDFRPEIIPEFPQWIHNYDIFPYVSGIALVLAGIVIFDIIKIKESYKKNTCLFLGFYFLTMILFFHLPFRLVVSPNKATHMGVWPETIKELAFSGGAFVMAKSFFRESSRSKRMTITLLEKLIPIRRIFFSISMILSGYIHFVYPDFIAAMVPKWAGFSLFWTYFTGGALIGSGGALLFNILVKPIGLLLALMLFLWVFTFHLPLAIANPYVVQGNEIIGAFDALLFCGVALVISNSERKTQWKVKFSD